MAQELDLDQYETTFRDNAIDSEVLPGLTADDLKDIGVTIVGHRRKLLVAIAALAAPRRAAAIAAERRPVTVLFCDLVGSTALAGRLDAEDWRDLVGAYADACREAVTDYGGHILKKLGDGLMALFGYPLAQENDAERAVRAALTIQRALSELNARNVDKGLPEIAARIRPRTRGRRWWTQPARSSAKRPTSPRKSRRSRNPARSSSPRTSSAMSRDCSSPRSVGPSASRASPNR